MAQHFGGAFYSMSFVKYRVKEVAADFGITPKEVSEIVGKYYEKPRSNTQTLTVDELNAVFEHITRHNQIADISQVFNVKPKEQPAPKAEQPEQKAEPKKEQPKKEQPKKEQPAKEAAPVDSIHMILAGKRKHLKEDAGNNS